MNTTLKELCFNLIKRDIEMNASLNKLDTKLTPEDLFTDLDFDLLGLRTSLVLLLGEDELFLMPEFKDHVYELTLYLTFRNKSLTTNEKTQLLIDLIIDSSDLESISLKNSKVTSIYKNLITNEQQGGSHAAH
jgi:hypothetical protein